MLRRALKLGLLFCLAIVPPAGAGADDILLNGNFVTGKVHWHGDGDVTQDGGSLFLVLKRDRWMVISQEVAARNSNLQLKLTYSFSNFCSLRHKRDRPAQPLTAQNLNESTGLSTAIPAVPLDGSAAALVLLLDRGRILRQSPIPVPSDGGGSHTFVATFVSSGGDKTLCLAFPPGKGMVTVSNVQLLQP